MQQRRADRQTARQPVSSSDYTEHELKVLKYPNMAILGMLRLVLDRYLMFSGTWTVKGRFQYAKFTVSGSKIRSGYDLWLSKSTQYVPQPPDPAQSAKLCRPISPKARPRPRSVPTHHALSSLPEKGKPSGKENTIISHSLEVSFF